MLSSLIATVVCSALPVETPLEFPALRLDGSVAADVGVHLTPTRLVLRNFTTRPQLCAFHDLESDAGAFVTLGPGARLEFQYPRAALETLALEVIDVHRGVWRASGLVALDATLALGAQTIWIQHEGAYTWTWLQAGNELELHESETSLLPERLRPVLEAKSPTCAPTHVPVITPSDRPKGDRPPKIGPRPLPPV